MDLFGAYFNDYNSHFFMKSLHDMKMSYGKESERK